MDFFNLFDIIDMLKGAIQMDVILIIANVLGFIGMGLFFITSALKNKKAVLSFQAVGHVFLAFSEFLQKSYSSIVQEVLCWIRDIGIISKKANKYFKIIILVLIVGVGITFNIIFDRQKPSYWFGYLVIFANLIWTIDVFYNNKNIILFKFISAFSNLSWMALFLSIQVYTSAAINGISGIINIVVGLIILIKYKKGKVDKLGIKMNKEENSEIEQNIENK